MGNTTIQWCLRTLPDGSLVRGHTFNPWWGCAKVSEECKNCYALAIAHHYGHEVWGPVGNTPRRLFNEHHWTEPLAWDRQAAKEGHRRNVFCASMADVYEEHPMVTEARTRLWEVIERTQWLNWLLLTKRPENILRLSPWKHDWPEHVWVGTSVGLQKRARERIPSLLEVPAAVHFLSCEPQLEELDLTPWLADVQWVISGGESGPGARPLNLDWSRSLRDQCQAAGVPYFFKQVGGRYHGSGGRLLDGRTWGEMPPEVPETLTRKVRS